MRTFFMPGRVPMKAAAAGALLATTLLSLTFPIVGIGAFIALMAFTMRSDRWARRLVILGVSALFAWTNVDKEIDGDWTWYTTHYEMLLDMNLGDYLGHSVAGINVSALEPVYYSLSFVLTRVTHGNIAALSIVVTSLIYLCVGGAISLLMDSIPGISRSTQLAALMSAMMAGVTFTLTTQLVRQELALAFGFLGIVLVLTRRSAGLRVVGALLLVASVLTHNSAIIPIGAVIAARIASPGARRIRVTFIIILAVVFFLAGKVWERAAPESYSLYDDGYISKSVIMLDGVLVAGLFVLERTSLRQWKPGVLTLGGLALLVSFLFAVIQLPIPFLRMYFYVEAFRTVIILGIVAWWLKDHAYRLVKAVIVVGVSAAYLLLRVASSPFTYEGGGVVGHIFWAPLVKSLLATP